MSAENIKTWPEAVFLRPHYPDNTLPTVNFNEYHFGMTHDFDRESDADIEYIRADIAAEREKEIILYLLNRYAPKPMGRTCQQTFMGLDVLKVYGEMGLERLK